MDKIRDGNVIAFEEAYKQWRAKGFNYFFRKTQVEEDAKDLLQTTFLRLWQYRNTLSSEYSLDQQLFYIARNVFVDYIRKSSKLEEVKVKFKDDIEVLSLENFQSMEFDTKNRMQKILETMPFNRRRVFELHKLEGYSYKEIAQNLDITEKSVDNHLAKALKQLRKIMTPFSLF